MEELAERAHTSPGQISKLQAKTRRLDVDWLVNLATALQCHPIDLLVINRRVPLIGKVNSVGNIFPISDATVDCPIYLESEKMAAIQVDEKGYFCYRKNDLLFCNFDQKYRSECLNNECLIQAHNGPLHIRTLQQSTDHFLFNLVHPHLPPINDVQIEWASKILWVKKA